MNRNLIFAALLFVFMVVFSPHLAIPALAQDGSPSERSSCRVCHEDLYYNYDTGKWYCLCGEQRTCTDCHHGVEGVWEVNEAHSGLVVNPILKDPGVCEDCHAEDTHIFVEKFALVAGIDLNTTPVPTQTAYIPVSLSAGEEPSTLLLQAEPFKPWQKLALGLVGFALIGVVVFGYYCWKADCQRTGRTVS